MKVAMKTVRELPESGHSINWLEYSVYIAKLTKEVHRLTGLVVPKDVELQLLPVLGKNASRLQEELDKAEEDKHRLSLEHKFVLAVKTEISELKTTTGLLVGSIRGVKARAFEYEKDLQKTQEVVAVWDSQYKALTDKVASLMEELTSIRLERDNLSSNLMEMAVLDQGHNDDVGKSLSSVSTEVLNTSVDMIAAVTLKIQADLVNEWKKMRTHFGVASACLALSSGDELLRRSFDAQRSLGKSSALFSSHVGRALDVGRIANKSASVGTKKGLKAT